MKYTYKLIKKADDIQIEEVESGYWWFLSSLIIGEEAHMNELLGLDIELNDEDFKDHIRSFKGAQAFIKNNHPELMI